MADTSELAAVKKTVERLKENITDEMEATLKRNQPTAVKTVEMNAKRLIESKADVGALGRKEGQTSLYNSFGSYVTTNNRADGVTGSLVVGSTAPHAAALNEGTDPHEIAPTNAPRLIFEGKPSDDYTAGGEKIEAVEEGAGYNGGDLVTMEKGAPVEHPGVSKTSYFEVSVRQLGDEIGEDLNNNIRKAILESGFRPSTN